MQDISYNINGIKIIGQKEIEELLKESKQSPRKRASACLHTEKSDLIQRMVMALQPETYMQAHRHAFPAKRELFVACRGEVVVVLFDEDGNVVEVCNLAPHKTQVVEISSGVYHALIAMEPDSVVFEIKDGPWESVEKDKQFAPWMPAEDTSESIEFLKKLKSMIV